MPPRVLNVFPGAVGWSTCKQEEEERTLDLGNTEEAKRFKPSTFRCRSPDL